LTKIEKSLFLIKLLQFLEFASEVLAQYTYWRPKGLNFRFLSFSSFWGKFFWVYPHLPKTPSMGQKGEIKNLGSVKPFGLSICILCWIFIGQLQKLKEFNQKLLVMWKIVIFYYIDYVRNLGEMVILRVIASMKTRLLANFNLTS